MSTAFSLFADAASPVAPLVPNSLYHVGGKDVVGDQFSGLFVFLPNGTGAANDDTIPVTGGGVLRRQTSDLLPQLTSAATSLSTLLTRLPTTLDVDGNLRTSGAGSTIEFPPDAVVGLAEGTSVALAAGTEVSLADGSSVALAANTVVGLASGATVALAPGAAVALAPGATVGLAPDTEVSIADGAVVALASGTSVNLAAGAVVALATDTEVALAENTSVALTQSTNNALATAIDMALRATPIPTSGGTVDTAALAAAIDTALRATPLPVAGGGGGASATDINNALKGSAQPTRTQVSSSQMIQVQTAANGTSWASFPVAPCQTITIYNQTGVRIRVGLDSSPTIYTVLEPDMGIPLATPNNSSNARVKRDDESTTQVAVTALAVL